MTTLAERAREAYAKKHKNEEDEQERRLMEQDAKRRSAVQRKARGLVPLIEKEVRKSIGAGWWRVPVPGSVGEAEAEKACDIVGLHFRGLEEYADGLHICVSVQPKEHEYLMGNTD